MDGLTTEYVLDVAGGLPEVILATAGGSSIAYVQLQGQVLAQHAAGAWTYALPDHLGSLRQLVDGDGQVTLAQSFDPFGTLSGAGLGCGADEDQLHHGQHRQRFCHFSGYPGPRSLSKVWSRI